MTDLDRERRLDELTDEMIERGRKTGEELAEATKTPPIMRRVTDMHVRQWVCYGGKKYVICGIVIDRGDETVELMLAESLEATAEFFTFGLQDKIEYTTPNIDKLLRANIREALEPYVK